VSKKKREKDSKDARHVPNHKRVRVESVLVIKDSVVSVTGDVATKWMQSVKIVPNMVSRAISIVEKTIVKK
jgi:hypothetical protein